MAEATIMTNLQLQDDILKNLLLGLQKQSQFYVQKINETGELTEERKNFEKELSDINKVLTELSNKALSYTVQELDQLRTEFNNKLLELNAVITDLEINTLKIEFDSLTPVQKQFLKGEKGDKGDKGYSPYEFAKMFGFTGTESDYLLSLKGDKGETGLTGKDFTYDMFTPEQLQLLKGADGQNGINGKDFTYDMFTPEQLALLKGADGQNGLNGKDFTFDMFTPEQLALLKGENGQDGAMTFADLTPEQIATLKGEKGDSFTFDMFTPGQLALLKGADGQNGIDGQSLTYSDLTESEKQDLASYVTVSGGGDSSSSNIVCIAFSKRLLMSEGAYTHLKTRIKFVDFLFARKQVTYFTSTNAFHSSNTFELVPTLVNSLRFVKTAGSIDASIVLSPYISTDGYLCFIVSTFSDSFYLDLCIDIRLKTSYDSSSSFIMNNIKTNSSNPQF